MRQVLQSVTNFITKYVRYCKVWSNTLSFLDYIYILFMGSFSLFVFKDKKHFHCLNSPPLCTIMINSWISLCFTHVSLFVSSVSTVIVLKWWLLLYNFLAGVVIKENVISRNYSRFYGSFHFHKMITTLINNIRALFLERTLCNWDTKWFGFKHQMVALVQVVACYSPSCFCIKTYLKTFRIICYNKSILDWGYFIKQVFSFIKYAKSYV